MRRSASARLYQERSLPKKARAGRPTEGWLICMGAPAVLSPPRGPDSGHEPRPPSQEPSETLPPLPALSAAAE
ncbi:hypothetical protein MRX96_044905 [Rhipicephalus microplus]